jgi:DNA repair/transcription protein MET18/MMS19
MSFLLRALDLPDEDLRADVIDILTAAAEGDVQEPNVMAEHASTLVSAMLKNAHVQNMPSTVRLQFSK